MRHLVAEDLFQLTEDQRPTSYELARDLGIATPPRIKRRGEALDKTWRATSGRSGPVASDAFLAKAVTVLWALCVVHWALISLVGASWLLSAPATFQESGFAVNASSLAARGFLGVGVFLVGAVGLSVFAFAEDQPKLISVGRFGFYIPARWPKSRPYSRHMRVVAATLLGILTVLAFAATTQAVLL